MTVEQTSLPILQIGLPTYNGERTLRRALSALLGQTFRDFELIISDNASTDATTAMCREFASRDHRIRYVRQERTIGPIENFLFVLQQASAPYFIWVADDDWWDATYIEKLMHVLVMNPACSVAQSSFQRIYEDDGSVFDEIQYADRVGVVPGSKQSAFRALCSGSLLNHYIYGLYRREFLEAVMRTPPQIESWEKVVMAEVVLATKLCTVPEVVRYSERRSRVRIKSKRVVEPGTHIGKPIPQAYFLPWRYCLVLLHSVLRVVRSKIVPLREKLFLFPSLMRLLWIERRRFIGIGWSDVKRFVRRRMHAMGHTKQV